MHIGSVKIPRQLSVTRATALPVEDRKLSIKVSASSRGGAFGLRIVLCNELRFVLHIFVCVSLRVQLRLVLFSLLRCALRIFLRIQ